MFRSLRTMIAAGAVAAAGMVAADTANAQWGYYGPSYSAPVGGRSFYFGFGTGPRYSHDSPSYGYGSYGRSYGYGAYGPSYGYGYSGYTPSGYYDYDHDFDRRYRGPRGRVEYDVYSPFGRGQVEYKVRRDGSIDVDYDD